MNTLTAIADRIIGRLVPQETAEARPCETLRYPCWSGSKYRCWYDNCEGFYLSCTRIGSC